MTPCMLAANQRALWMMQALRGDRSSLNVSGIFTLAPDVDVAVLREACRRVIGLHPALSRCVTLTNGNPVYERAPGVHDPGDLDVIPVAGTTDRGLSKAIATAARRRFRLERGPLYRLTLFAPDRSKPRLPPVLAVVLHHLIADFPSIDLLARQIETAYQDMLGLTAPVPMAPAPAGDRDPQRIFVNREAAYRMSPCHESDSAHWRASLAAWPGATTPGTTHPGTTTPSTKGSSGTGHEIRKSMGRRLSGRLRAVARGLALTPFELLLATYALCLAGRDGRADGCIGFTVDLRHCRGPRGRVGYFVAPLPLLFGFAAGEPLAAVLERFGRQARRARRHGRFPLADMQEFRPTGPGSKGVNGSKGPLPLFRCLFNFLKFEPDFGGKGGRWRLIRGIWKPVEPIHGPTMYDVSLRIEDWTDHFVALWQFDEGALDRAGMTGLRENFERLSWALPTALEGPVDAWIAAARLPPRVAPAGREVAEL